MIVQSLKSPEINIKVFCVILQFFYSNTLVCKKKCRYTSGLDSWLGLHLMAFQ